MTDRAKLADELRRYATFPVIRSFAGMPRTLNEAAEALAAAEARPPLVSSRAECGELLDTINDALGCIDPGRGDWEYAVAKRALAALRDLLDADAVAPGGDA